MTGLYFDSAYIAKCYLREPDAPAVRALAGSGPALYVSALAMAEVSCVFHRQLREKTLTPKTAAAVRDLFLADIEAGTWQLLPITDRLLRRVETHTRKLRADLFLRAGDAIHIATAIDGGFQEIWTNDRHLLATAAHFGLKGRSVPSP